MQVIDVLSDSKYKKKPIIEKIVMFYMDMTKEELFTDLDRLVPAKKLKTIDNAYYDYVNEKKPLEYIFGSVEFFGYKFKVTQDTIIPRPETEYMIEAVKEHFKTIKSGHVIDIGTGCGILGISSVLHNKPKVRKVLLSDISTDALDVARENAKTLIPEFEDIEFVESDLLKNLIKDNKINENKIPILIVANLPYIPNITFETDCDESVKLREPLIAFLGGKDGCNLYRIMLDQIILLGKTNVTLFLEMMGWQAEVLEEEYGRYYDFEQIKTFHANIRIVKASTTEEFQFANKIMMKEEQESNRKSKTSKQKSGKSDRKSAKAKTSKSKTSSKKTTSRKTTNKKTSSTKSSTKRTARKSSTTRKTTKKSK